MDQSTLLVKLHPRAKFISFEHKHSILKAFSNIQGMLGIDYFSLMIVDSKKQVSLYSTCPSLEFSLISDNLWEVDGMFNQKNHLEDALFFWDELYHNDFKNTLIKEKETKFGFNFGLCVMKQLKDIFVIYSFATKTQNEKELYRNSKDTLLKIGDCLYNELKSIHRQYVAGERMESPLGKASRYLKLVIDNTRRKKTEEKDRLI